MKAHLVLEMLRSRGMSLDVEDGQLVVEYDEISESDRDLIRAYRRDLIAILTSSAAVSPGPRKTPPIPSGYSWREVVAWWPVEWRQRWADLAEARAGLRGPMGSGRVDRLPRDRQGGQGGGRSGRYNSSSASQVWR